MAKGVGRTRTDEITRERCRQIVDSWKVPLSQIRVDKSGNKYGVSIYINPSNAVDMSFDNPRRKAEIIEYLLTQGVLIDEH